MTLNDLALDELFQRYMAEQQSVHPYSNQPYDLPPATPPLLDMPPVLQALGYLGGRAADAALFGIPTAALGKLERPEGMEWLKYPGFGAEVAGFALGGPARLGAHIATKIAGKALAKGTSATAAKLIGELGWAPTGFATEFIRQGGAAIRGEQDASRVMEDAATAALMWPAIGMGGTLVGKGLGKALSMGEGTLARSIKEAYIKVMRIPPENAEIIRKKVPDRVGLVTRYVRNMENAGMSGLFTIPEIYGKGFKGKFPELAYPMEKGLRASEMVAITSHTDKTMLEGILKPLGNQGVGRMLAAYQGLPEGSVTHRGVAPDMVKELLEAGLSAAEIGTMPKYKYLMDRIWNRGRSSMAYTTKDAKATKDLVANQAAKELKAHGKTEKYEGLMSQVQDYDKYLARMKPGYIPNYAPHTMVGDLRLYKVVKDLDESGNEVTTLHPIPKFYKNNWDAAKDLQKLGRENPNEQYKVMPTFDWASLYYPTTELGDTQYKILLARMADAMGMTQSEAATILRGTGVGTKGKRAFNNHFLRRTGAPGFSEDWRKVLDLYVDGMARYTHFNKFKYQVLKYTNSKEIQAADPSLKATIEEYVKDIMGGRTWDEEAVTNLIEKAQSILKIPLFDMIDAKWALRKGVGASRVLTTHLKLGFGNPSSALLNLTQTLVNVWPLVPTKYLVKGIRRAYRMAPADAKILEAQGVRFFAPKYAEAGGQILYPTGGKGLWERAQSLSLHLFNKAERFNRATAYWAKVEQLQATTKMSPAQVHKIARTFTLATQFPYEAAGLPGFLRHGQIGRLGGQFKSFALKEMGFAMNIAKAGDPIAMAKFVGALTAIGGALSLPMAMTMNSLFKGLTGYDVLGRLKEEALKEHQAGNPVPYAVLHGVPGVFGPDMTMRVEVGNFWPTDVGSLEGPFISTISDLVAYLESDHPQVQELKGSALGTISTMLKAAGRGAGIPAARNVGEALEMLKTGKLTSPYTGREVMKAPGGAIATKLLGIRTKGETIASTQRQLAKTGYSHDIEVKRRLVDRLLDAQMDGDAPDTNRAWVELLRWAKRRKENYRNLNEYIRKRHKERIMTEQQYLRKVTPKVYRPGLGEIGVK